MFLEFSYPPPPTSCPYVYVIRVSLGAMVYLGLLLSDSYQVHGIVITEMRS